MCMLVGKVDICAIDFTRIPLWLADLFHIRHACTGEDEGAGGECDVPLAPSRESGRKSLAGVCLGLWSLYAQFRSNTPR